MTDEMPDMSTGTGPFGLNQKIIITTEVFGDAVAVKTEVEPGFDDMYAQTEFLLKTLIAVVSGYLPEAITSDYSVPEGAIIGRMTMNDDELPHD